MEPSEPGDLYEILKIWVPTHGVIIVYRKPGGVYHVDNGCQLEPATKFYGQEKLRILASHASVITITRKSVMEEEYQNKYTIDPSNLSIDASEVWVESRVR